MLHSNTNTHSPHAYTLVELIVVIAILVVLSTVGFVGYSQYTASSRDGARVSDLRAIYQGIGVSISQKGIAPAPDSPVSIYASTGVLLSLQGNVGESVRQAIGLESGGRDPQDGVGYTYLRFKDKKSVQLMGYFESDGWGPRMAMNNTLGDGEEFALDDSTLWNATVGTTAYAATDYTDRYPATFGKKLGILVDSTTNTPLQEVSSYTASGVNLGIPSIATGSGILVIGNTGSGVSENLSGTGVLARVLSPASLVVADGSPAIILAPVYSSSTTYTAGQTFSYNGANITVSAAGIGVASTKSNPASDTNDIAVWQGGTNNIQVWAATNVGATTTTGYDSTSPTAAVKGGLYQWGRNDDVRSGTYITSPYTGAFTSPANTTGNNNFYAGDSSYGDWRGLGTINPVGGWNVANGGNNQGPCTAGYHIPTAGTSDATTEWGKLYTIINSAGTFGSCAQANVIDRTVCAMKLPYAGYRNWYDGQYSYQGTAVLYWSSSPNGFGAYNATFVSGGSNIVLTNAHGFGFSLRCVKD